MTDQPRLDFTRDDLPPINGTTSQSRHASYTGAVHALETRSANVQALRQLWRDPHTIQDVAAITGLPISSVCSLKSCLDLIPAGFEVQDWGPSRRSTKRTLWKLRSTSASL